MEKEKQLAAIREYVYDDATGLDFYHIMENYLPNF